MTTIGRSIRIYLADGSPTGIRHAELANWTGQAIVCPRLRVGELAHWPESQKPGVYFLVGDDPSKSKPLVYVGEAENVLQRVQHHLKNKEFWSHLVFFTNKDENLTKAHVKYLESRLVELALRADRVSLENSNSPQLPALPRPDRDAMEEFLEPARILLGSLGFTILQPLVKPPSADKPPDDETSENDLSQVPLYLKVPKRSVEAEGRATDEGFLVFAGAQGSKDISDSMGSGWMEIKKKLVADGILEETATGLQLCENYLFKSPSAAAAILCGTSRNGRKSWADKAGRTLKQLEEEIAEQSPI